MPLSVEDNNGPLKLEDEGATWPLEAHYTTEPLGKEALLVKVINPGYQGKSEFLIHNKSKEDCVYNPGDSLIPILVLP